MATRYRLPDGIRDGEIEAEEVWGGCAGGRPEYQLAGGFTLLAPAGQPLERVKPPVPEEPPVGAVVIVDGDACQRFDEPYEDVKVWGSAGSTERWTWVQLCALALPGTPTRLVPDPFAEPVPLPWEASGDVEGRSWSVGVEATTRGTPKVLVSAAVSGQGAGVFLFPPSAREMAAALMSAADAAEKEQS